MPIFQEDGQPFELKGTESLQTFRPEDNVDFNQFNEWDKEQIQLGGSEVIYYRPYIDSNFDPVYMESRDTIIAQEGYSIYSVFQPVRPTQDFNMFGIDSPDEIIMNFNLSQWKELIGEMPKIKGLFFTKFENNWWEVVQSDHAEEYKIWRKYRLQVVCRKYQKSTIDQQTTRKDADDISINIF